jgi:hypothetical protein
MLPVALPLFPSHACCTAAEEPLTSGEQQGVLRVDDGLLPRLPQLHMLQSAL